MRIAFYTPLNAPDSDVPSGDRLMARQIIALLREMGHEVRQASTLRTWLRQPDDLAAITANVPAEFAKMSRIFADWLPDLWFTYHMYFKAPDLLGPRFCEEHGLPYVIAEPAFTRRHGGGPWAQAHAVALRALQRADLLLPMTLRDIDGLAECPGLTQNLLHLPPFLAADKTNDVPLPRSIDANHPVKLLAVAMMRAGDKLTSYHILAETISRLDPASWRLGIVGDGPARPDVEASFAKFDPSQITWHGQCDVAGVQAVLASADILTWPGRNEAYGMVYLEAQALGLPVAAMDSAGVSAVVEHGVSGLLAADSDIGGYSDHIATLIRNPALRQRFGAQGRDKVMRDHSEANAMRVLAAGFSQLALQNTQPALLATSMFNGND